MGNQIKFYVYTPVSFAVFFEGVGWTPVDAVGRLLAAVVAVWVGVVVVVGFGVGVTVDVKEDDRTSPDLVVRFPVNTHTFILL